MILIDEHISMYFQCVLQGAFKVTIVPLNTAKSRNKPLELFIFTITK